MAKKTIQELRRELSKISQLLEKLDGGYRPPSVDVEISMAEELADYVRDQVARHLEFLREEAERTSPTRRAKVTWEMAEEAFWLQ